MKSLEWFLGLEFPTQCNDPVRSTNRWHDAKKVTAPASDVTWLIDRPQVMCRVSADGFSLSVHKACVRGGLCELGVDICREGVYQGP